MIFGMVMISRKQSKKYVLWDSNCIIGYLENTDFPYIRQLNQWIEHCEQGNGITLISSISVAECHFLRDYDDDTEVINQFMLRPYVHIVAFDFDMAQTTQDLKRQFRLGPKQCVDMMLIASAIHCKDNIAGMEFITDDTHLLSKASVIESTYELKVITPYFINPDIPIDGIETP